MMQSNYEEILTEAERKQVVEKVKDMLVRALSMKPSPFSHVTYCYHCPGSPLERIKRPCLCRPSEGDAICPSCWALEKEKELMDMLVKAKKPKEPFPVAELKYGGLVPLDVEDFARI